MSKRLWVTIPNEWRHSMNGSSFVWWFHVKTNPLQKTIFFCISFNGILRPVQQPGTCPNMTLAVERDVKSQLWPLMVFRGLRWQSGNTLTSHIWDWGSVPDLTLSGKVGSCLPLVGSLQYITLTNCMYWFTLPIKLPVVIWPVQCWKWYKTLNKINKFNGLQSWGLTSPPTARVILGQVLSIATCGTRTHRGDSLWLDAKLANH